jgi:uncharacterized protein YndB with AHSA1/START domain
MAAPWNAISSDAARPSVTFKRRLEASPATVYAAWTDPQKIVQWFGRPEAKPDSRRAEVNVRVGGRFRFSFSTDSEYYEVGGVYREVVPDRRLVFSWAWHSTPERESLVTITLKPDGAGTLMIFHHAQFFDETARDNHQRGWSSFFDKLDSFVA